MLGARIGNPALGSLITRHDRPTLLVYIAADLPSIFVLHLDEFLALRRVPVELRHANRSQTLGHRSGSGLLRHHLGATVGHPATDIETDIHGHERADDSAPRAMFNFLPVHYAPPSVRIWNTRV